MQITNTAWALLIVLSVLWGGSFFFVEVAVSALPPLTLVWLRVALAAAALLALLAITGRRLPLSRPALVAFAGMGVLNNLIPFTLIVSAQTEIASGLASIINAMTPVSAVLLAHFFTADERLTGLRAAGVALGILGVTVLIGWEALGGLGAAVIAQLAVLLATVSYGVAGLWGRRFRALGIGSVEAAAGQVTASTLLLAIPAIVIDRPWAIPLPGLEIWASVIGLALLSTALAYVLFFRILAIAGAGNVMLVTLMVPPSAILLGWLILGERIEAQHLAGLAIIALGLVFLDGRLPRRLAEHLGRRPA
ncbi:MAG: DMT family transporter [Pseudomonadota bacterium]